MNEIGWALSVGLNSVDPKRYGGWAGVLRACENDARAMRDLARRQGFEARLLLGRDVTVNAVLGHIAAAAERLRARDIFLLTASCHGTQRRDEGADPEPDEFDEALCFYDQIVLDDTIRVALSAFRPGVRLLTCMDSCYAATNTRGLQPSPSRVRAMPAAVATSPAVQAMFTTIFDQDETARTTPGYRPEEVALAACREDETAEENDTHGYFTDALLRTWDGGGFAGNHLKLHAAIRNTIRGTQTPTIGYRAGSALPTRRPFQIARATKGIVMPKVTVTPKPDPTPVTTSRPRSTQVDNWPDVLEALRDLGLEFTIPEPAEPEPPTPDAGEGPVRMFWWGFHIELDPETVDAVLDADDVTTALVDRVAAAAPGPTIRWIPVAGRYAAESSALVRKANEGDGVRINMSWLAPETFVTTPVPRAAEPVEPVEPSNRTLQSISRGERLTPGDQMVSPDGTYSLQVNPDGNLALRRGDDDVWVSGLDPDRQPHLRQPLFRPSFAELTPEGTLVICSEAGLPLWAAGSPSRAEASTLQLLDTGNLVAATGSGNRLWQTDPAAGRVRTRADVLQQSQTSDVGWGKRMESTATLYRNGTLVVDSGTYNSNWFGGLRGRTLVVISDAEGRMIWTSPIFHDPTRCSVPDVSCASNGRVTHVDHMPASVGEFGTRIDIYHGDNPNYVNLRNVIIDIIKSFVDIAAALKDAWDQLQKM